MSYIIAVSSSKGGPGKTNAVANLADCWAMDGLKVALIDSDPNKNLSNWYSKQIFENAFENIDLKTVEDEERQMEIENITIKRYLNMIIYPR